MKKKIDENTYKINEPNIYDNCAQTIRISDKNTLVTIQLGWQVEKHLKFTLVYLCINNTMKRQ